MIAVSNGWVNAHKETLLPEMFLEITCEATDPSLQRDANVSSNNEAYFSETDAVIYDIDKKQETIASLELGLWGLDGTFSYLDDDIGDAGYVSASVSLANNNTFSTTPTIEITFPTLRQVLIPGLTITWSEAYGEWATRFRVTVYNGDIQLNQRTVVDNQSITSTIWMDMVDYTRITIEILEWSHPNHRARCTDVFLGIKSVYYKEDLMGFDHTQSADLLSASLPKNEITFRLRNEDNRWNPDNPTGVEQYLLEQQEVRLRYGMTVDGQTEWIKGGTFWLSEWSTPHNGLEATFVARDAIEFMQETYTGPMTGTLYDIAVAAFEQADLPSLATGEQRWYVTGGMLEAYSVDLSEDPPEMTIAEALQMVAHAGNCVFYQDRDGVVRIEPWNTNYSGFMIDQHVSYSHPEYEFTKPVKSVSVAYGEDRAVVPVADRGEVQTVDNEFITTRPHALAVGERAREILESRKVISGDFRADVRLDALDPIIVTSKYATNIVAITDVSYSTTGGAFRGSYTGRVVSLALQTEDRYSDEFYVGEI